MHVGNDMSNNLPPLNWLRTFEVAARELNFTVAARELNMTQSAVSQQVRLLEDYLNEPLFNRAARQINLTKRGRAYLPVIQSALRELQRGTSDIFLPLKGGGVTIEVNTAFSIFWLAPRLQFFTVQYPNLALRIINANWDSEFSAGSAELSLRHGTGDWPDLDFTRLITPKLRPYCSPQIAAQIHQPSDVLQWPLLDVIGNLPDWRTWLAQYHLQPSSTQLIHKTDSAVTTVPMAISHCGICLSYDEILAPQVATGQLAAPLDDYLVTTESYFLVHRKDRPLSKAAEVFKQWIVMEIG
jgi:LysR family glycine cleavage system transcriptional activator